jgi:hypothetical protein
MAEKGRIIVRESSNLSKAWFYVTFTVPKLILSYLMSFICCSHSDVLMPLASDVCYSITRARLIRPIDSFLKVESAVCRNIFDIINHDEIHAFVFNSEGT